MKAFPKCFDRTADHILKVIRKIQNTNLYNILINSECKVTKENSFFLSETDLFAN